MFKFAYLCFTFSSNQDLEAIYALFVDMSVVSNNL